MQEHTQWKKELAVIASIIDKAPLEKVTKWGSDVYTYNGKNVVSYGGFKHYFAIWFYNGVFLKDPYHILLNAQEGKTKSLRQWRLTSMEEIVEKRILEYIQEAIEVEKQGLKIIPDRFTPVSIPALLEEALQQDSGLKVAFDKLSPGRQKEYMVYITEAKQDATKISRLEKIKPMILQGIGLNDKYK